MKIKDEYEKALALFLLILQSLVVADRASDMPSQVIEECIQSNYVHRDLDRNWLRDIPAARANNSLR